MAFTGCGRSTRSINFLSFKRTLQYNGLYIPCMYFTRVTLITLTVCCSSAPVLCQRVGHFVILVAATSHAGRSLIAHHKHNTIIAYLINIIIILYCVAAVRVCKLRRLYAKRFCTFLRLSLSLVTSQNTLAFF